MKLKKINNKKALSDLVSYVLLIVIALSLSIGVYSFMKFYIPKDKEKCSDETSISIENYNCEVSADSRILKLQLKNRGLFNIEGFYIRASNTTNVPTIMLNPAYTDPKLIAQKGRYDFINSLKPSATTEISFDYGIEGLEIVKRIQLQPIILGSKNQTLICPNIADINLDTCEAPVQDPITPTPPTCTPNCGDTSTYCNGITYSNGCPGGENACIGTKLPDCGTRVCGISPNTCGSCGTCSSPKPVCNATFQCEETAKTSLIAYYPFDGNANDASGKGNNPTTVGTGVTSTASGKVGQAYHFDGTANAYIKIADSSSLSITGTKLTLSAWIKPTTNALDIIHKNSQYSIFSKSISEGLTGTGLNYADSITWSYPTIGEYGIIQLNQWNQVATTFDGTNIKFYINGTLVGTKARTGNLIDNANPLFIGCYSDGGTPSGTACSKYYFNGDIDEVRIYNSTLSATEIAQL